MTRIRTSRFNLLVLVLLLAIIALSGSVPAAAQEPVLRSAVPTEPLQVPVFFEANQGQFDDQVRFVARAPGASFWFTPADIRIVLDRIEPDTGLRGAMDGRARPAPAGLVERLAFTVRLLDASPGSLPEGQGLLPGKVNYFLGRDPARWRAQVLTYGSILYRDLYPRADLRYYGAGDGLKYDLILHPGAEVEMVSLAYDGVQGLQVNDTGQLEIATAWGTLIEEAPLAWQEDDGGRRDPVAAAYRLQAGNRIGFWVGAYDPTRPLVLDPTLNYSTFVGGGTRELAHAVALDEAGNAVITGSTTSNDFPVTEGALDPVRSDGWDAFVTKLDANGESLIFSTYVGGLGTEVGYGVAVDEAGNVVVAGATGSTDFPTTSDAYREEYEGGEYDAFVLKLAPGGDSLLYGTFVGGNDMDMAYTLGLYGEQAVIAGVTESPNFPTTSNAFDRYHNGLGDLFITKLDADGGSLSFSTLVGGSGEDLGRRLAVASGGNVVVTGHTNSANFPTSSDAFAPDYRRKYDAFVLELNSDGRSLNYSTFLGARADEYGQGLALDANGDPVVTGATSSADFPTTTGAYDTHYNGYSDVFVAKVTDNGKTLAWSTYLGGSGSDSGMVVGLDANDNPILAGTTDSTDLPISDDALDDTYNGESDVLLAKLSASGDSISYSTYAGGAARDEATGLAVTNAGDVVVAGWTESFAFPTTEGAFDPEFNGRQDGFLMRIDSLGDPEPQAIDLQVAQSSDDAIESNDDGSVDLDSPVLELLDDDSPHSAGLRFQGLGISQDAKVQRAYVEFTAADTSSRATDLTFRGQADDDAATFTGAAHDISSQPVTTASVQWLDVPNWNKAGGAYRSPDLSAIVQEIIDRPGWIPGNALALMITGSGKREAISYDGDPDESPRLHIEYEGEEPACYNLGIVAEPVEGGTVMASPTPNCEITKYVTGTQVTLTAQPAEDYAFQAWSGNATGSTNPTTITVSSDQAVTAHFRDKDAPRHILYVPVILRATQ